MDRRQLLVRFLGLASLIWTGCDNPATDDLTGRPPITEADAEEIRARDRLVEDEENSDD